MSDSYLWDRSGEPDPEVQRLERVLGTLRYDRPAPDVATASRNRIRRWLWVAAFVAAAAVVAFVVSLSRPHSAPGAAWDVSRVDGAPCVGTTAFDGSAKLGIGEWLETDGKSRARIDAANIGHVDVEPDTRIGLVATGRDEHRLNLAHGSISAKVYAPPRLFLVETPSAVAVDLGCAYTLEVDRTGAGVLSVSSGWVSFERDGRESYVIKNAECRTRPGIGPGTPFMRDAPEALQRALYRFDFEKGGSAALHEVLDAAREIDNLTLWHLLSRVDGVERERVYDKMVAHCEPPDGVTRAGILRLDKSMLERWKLALR
ncbi:MAG: FecR domain-containing protein [Planctomycetes bacterium]|nr:FecR domain-containing protein [Planctomycetota bacterium]